MLGFFSSSQKPKSDKNVPSKPEDINTSTEEPNNGTISYPSFSANVANLKAQFNELPPATVTLAMLLVGGVSTVAAVHVHKRYASRIINSQWVTPSHLGKRRWLKGVVTSVGDADNFRLYHTPPIGYTWPFKWKTVPKTAKELKDETIHIRLAGIDAPEAGHFGKPAQPYSAEALAWLRSKILSKVVYCQLLKSDQYGRTVAEVQLPPRILPSGLFNGQNVAIEMLKAGWAVTYEQAGAQYGKIGKEGYIQLEKDAKRAKKGMWRKGTSIESPADYKRRMASDGGTTKSKTRPASEDAPRIRRNRNPQRGWWRGLFFK